MPKISGPSRRAVSHGSGLSREVSLYMFIFVITYPVSNAGDLGFVLGSGDAERVLT